MAVAALPGVGYAYYPFDYRVLEPTNLMVDAFRIDSSNFTKLAVGGRVWFEDRSEFESDGTTPLIKNITRVHWRWGTVVKSGGTSLRLSLQTPEAFPQTDTPRPSGTVGQSVLIANSDAGVASNTWYRSAALDAVRAVQFDEKLSIVLEPQTSVASGDQFAWAVREQVLGDSLETPWAAVEVVGSAYIRLNHVPNVILEFDDGTFGTLNNSYVTANASTLSFSTSSGKTEYGMQFSLPWAARVDGAVVMGLDGGADCVVSLYSGTTVLASNTFDAQYLSSAVDLKEVTLAETVLSANQSYILAVKVTDALNSVTIRYEDLSEAGHRKLWGDTNLSVVRRAGTDPWETHSTTRILQMGVRFSALEAG